MCKIFKKIFFSSKKVHPKEEFNVEIELDRPRKIKNKLSIKLKSKLGRGDF